MLRNVPASCGGCWHHVSGERALLPRRTWRQCTASGCWDNQEFVWFGSLLTPIRRSQSSHRCVKVGGCWWLGRWWLVSAWHLMVEPGPEKASCVRAGTGLVVVTREGAGWSPAISSLILHLYSKYLEMGPGEPILPFACMLALLYISRALF